MRLVTRWAKVALQTLAVLMMAAILAQNIPMVRRAEAQLVNVTSGSSLGSVTGAVVAVAQVLTGGIQVGANGYPVSAVYSGAGTVSAAGITAITVTGVATPNASITTLVCTPATAQSQASLPFGYVAWVSQLNVVALQVTPVTTSSWRCTAFVH